MNMIKAVHISETSPSDIIVQLLRNKIKSFEKTD